jgi:hypothetical protein
MPHVKTPLVQSIHVSAIKANSPVKVSNHHSFSVHIIKNRNSILSPPQKRSKRRKTQEHDEQIHHLQTLIHQISPEIITIRH